MKNINDDICLEDLKTHKFYMLGGLSYFILVSFILFLSIKVDLVGIKVDLVGIIIGIILATFSFILFITNLIAIFIIKKHVSKNKIIV